MPITNTTIMTNRDNLLGLIGKSFFGTDNLVDLIYAKSGAGTPTDTSTTPDFIGQKYYDSTNKVWYIAVDYTPAAADFQAIGGTSVQGPSSSTDEAIARFDGTTGELLQNGVVTVTDAGAVAGVTTQSQSGNTTYTAAAAGPTLKQGSNGRVGTFTCNGATPVAVSNTSIAITDAIIISLNTVGGTVGAVPSVKTITASSGFTVAGTASDTSVYNYAIIKNAA